MIPTAKDLKNLIENYGYLKEILLMLLSSGVTFFLTKRKMEAEIQKIRTESMEKKINIISLVNKYRADFIKSGETCGLLINEVVNSMKEKDIEKIKTGRLEVNNFFFNDYMLKFNEYFDLKKETLSYNHKEARYFIEDDILPFLNLISYFKNTTNFEFILEIVSSPPVNISEDSIKHLKRFVTKNTKLYNFILRKKFNNLFNQIIKS